MSYKMIVRDHYILLCWIFFKQYKLNLKALRRAQKVKVHVYLDGTLCCQVGWQIKLLYKHCAINNTLFSN